MKTVLLVLICSLVRVICFSQDFSDEKVVSNLKNVKFKSAVDKDKSYSIILKDNSLLTIKYNIIEGEELNADYSFIKTPTDELFFKNTMELNLKLLLSNLPYWASTLGLTNEQATEIKSKISGSVNLQGAKKNFFVSLDLKGYDESTMSFTNYEEAIVCRFYFKRLL